MLFLGETDLLKAAALDELMDAIELAYSIEQDGAYFMPPRMHVNRGEDTLLYMPCFVQNLFGTKMLTLFPGNAEKNKPVIEGLMLLNDAETGVPLAALDGAKLTAVRTGAVCGAAIRHITPKGIQTLGIIGAGIQAFHQALFACEARPVRQIGLFDSSPGKAHALAAKLKEALPGIVVEALDTAAGLVTQSDIIITATPSPEPVMPDDPAMLKGRHYFAIGSYKPAMRELPASLFTLVNRIFIDTTHGLDESGDLITPLESGWIKRDQLIPFGRFLRDKESCGAMGDTTLFKSVGAALFDIVAAEFIYRRALEKKIGQKVDLKGN